MKFETIEVANLLIDEINNYNDKIRILSDRLLDTNYFMALCRDHHKYYTEHSREAIEKGVSVSRTAKI